jgi:hypothetical protein
VAVMDHYQGAKARGFIFWGKYHRLNTSQTKEKYDNIKPSMN